MIRERSKISVKGDVEAYVVIAEAISGGGTIRGSIKDVGDIVETRTTDVATSQK